MRRVAFAVMSTIAGLVGLLSFKTHSPTVPTPTSLAAGSAGNAGGAGGAGTATDPTPSAAASSAASAAAGSSAPSSARPSSSASSASSPSGTYTGDVIDTRWGPVQVRITVADGKVTGATAVEYPSGDPRSQQINAYAVPVLQQETTGATSTDSVDMVSGATYTSDGYLQSLQSALDRAGL